MENIDKPAKILEGVKEICGVIETIQPSQQPSFSFASIQGYQLMLYKRGTNSCLAVLGRLGFESL